MGGIDPLHRRLRVRGGKGGGGPSGAAAALSLPTDHVDAVEGAERLIVASLELVFAAVSTVVLIASVFAMVPLYLPPSFGDNFREFRRAWRMEPG
ncbi:hypothetical protein J2R99_000435 [Rhodopseudomonas julia]|uniref:Uncharacterized protein n=1 Tax=Rhodopseudomonas julia TaxID=200617 RepID=A0ABU0C251_9BRAD|nr:hypothetical protein [Rhodopseudomonas julia]MDQ0324586.1 hypothetical protein [Rhodopseudomonas julia]